MIRVNCAEVNRRSSRHKQSVDISDLMIDVAGLTDLSALDRLSPFLEYPHASFPVNEDEMFKIILTNHLNCHPNSFWMGRK